MLNVFAVFFYVGVDDPAMTWCFVFQVLEQALWLLGNLAGEGATARDAVLAVDALPPLVRCLERHQVAFTPTHEDGFLYLALLCTVVLYLAVPRVYVAPLFSEM